MVYKSKLKSKVNNLENFKIVKILSYFIFNMNQEFEFEDINVLVLCIGKFKCIYKYYIVIKCY